MSATLNPTALAWLNQVAFSVQQPQASALAASMKFTPGAQAVFQRGIQQCYIVSQSGSTVSYAVLVTTGETGDNAAVVTLTSVETAGVYSWSVSAAPAQYADSSNYFNGNACAVAVVSL
jgi:hypothetical protein